MKVITIFLFSLISISIYGQCPPQSWNMTVLDQWSNPYPIAGGANSKYNDVWAYVNATNAYAIIGGRDSFYIIDVTDPNDIFHVQSIGQGDFTSWRDFKVYGDFLYTMIDGTSSSNYYGVVVYDLSNLPGTVTRVTDLDQEFVKCHNIYIDESNARLYAVGMPGTTDICVYDLTLPSSPELGGCYNLDTIEDIPGNGYIHDVFVRNNVAYAGHGHGGYHIWDMNDLDNITYAGGLSGQFFDGGYVHSSWNSDDNNYAVVATELGPSLSSGDPKLYWVDQSNPFNIQILHEYKDPLCIESGTKAYQRPHNPYILDGIVYSSFYHDGLVALEIAGDSLKRVGYYDTYPEFTSYTSGTGFNGCWGAYPYLPSGSTSGIKTILASDQKNGLFTLKFDHLSLYTFIGPGTNWDVASNWENNQKPPMNFDGLIKITSNCVVNASIVNSLSGRLEVETGVTVTYGN